MGLQPLSQLTLTVILLACARCFPWAPLLLSAHFTWTLHSCRAMLGSGFGCEPLLAEGRWHAAQRDSNDKSCASIASTTVLVLARRVVYMQNYKDQKQN